jgi:putative flippase GtrA
VTHRRTIPRYLIVGAALALISNLILIVFDRLGIHYAVSCVVAFLVTLVLAYWLHTHWTFEANRSFVGLFRYGAAMLMNVPISIMLLFMLVTVGGMSMILAAPAATVLLTLCNYLIARALMLPRSTP